MCSQETKETQEEGFGEKEQYVSLHFEIHVLFGIHNVSCFHRGVPNFISANSLEIRLFEFDGPTQSLL